MKILEARQFIQRTFEYPFDKDRYTYFIKNLLKESYEVKPFIQAGAHLPNAFSSYIRKLERLGKYEDADGNIIDILIVELKRGHSVEFARTTQRNFIRRYLNGSRGGELKDAALVSFHTEGFDDWRFSLVKMQYSLEKKKDDLTPAKRFSFLVGKNEKSHTAQKQLTDLLAMDALPTLTQIESAFNIETVTREFFEKYKQLFIDLNDFFEKEFQKSHQLRDELASKNIDTVSFAKKLLGQIVFLYFLQKKGWLGVPKDEPWGKGDKRFLRTLWEKARTEKKNFFNDYLEFLFYEALAEERRNAADPAYYKYLDCKIPFLNGGLFEAEYDWKNITTNIPDHFFSNTTQTSEGDIGNGILDVFDRYNFTIKEDEPLDKEVAVDPEMLGKVLENLLEVKDRKSKGAFYTPREIVHYMCQESLINYLDTALNGEGVVYQNVGEDQLDVFGNKYKEGQLDLVAEHGSIIKVPRPAIESLIRAGSQIKEYYATVLEKEKEIEAGRQKTSEYKIRVEDKPVREYAVELDKALENIRICDPAIGSGAFPVGMMNEIVKTREILSVYLPDDLKSDRSPYEFKRHCIQESIYGVDIDHSAIDIAKLRLWLSLVVDEQDLSTVKPLPNLDYKIVQGNSLIGMPYEPGAMTTLETLKRQLFDEYTLEKKEALRKQINDTLVTILDIGSRQLGMKIDFDFNLFFSEVFQEKKGFDIIIGNPPYGVSIRDEYRKIVINSYGKVPDFEIYYYFIEIANKFLKEDGILTYITPNTFLFNVFARNYRLKLLENWQLLLLLDCTNFKLFEHATVLNVISFFKNVPTANLVGYKNTSEARNFNDLILTSTEFIDKTELIINNTNWGLLFKLTKSILKIIDKIKSCGAALNSIFPDISQGLIAYDRYKGQSKEIIESRAYHFCQYKSGLKQWLWGEDITRYKLSWNGKEWIDYGSGIANPREPKYFKNPRILIREITNPRIFAAYTDEENYNDPAIINVLGQCKENLFWLLAILNSSLATFFHFNSSPKATKGAFPKILVEDIKNFPIPIIENEKKQIIINLVDKILTTKKQDPIADTSNWEHEIDVMVYHLYGLTYEEAKVIEPELSKEEFEKSKNIV